MLCVVVIMARAPRLGEVKTRLAAALGGERALTIYREITERVVTSVRDSEARIVVAFTPADGGDEMRGWLGSGFAYQPQRTGDLGHRMAGAIGAQFAAGADRVVVVGTDCPTLDAGTVRAAFDALDADDVVFGPASDGGYYLVGMRAPHPELFDDVPWSSEQTLAVSLERARAAELRIALLDEMRDIDTVEDWHWHVARRGA